MKRLFAFSALVIAGLAPLAKADLQITYQIDGGAVVTCGPVGVGTGPFVQCANTGSPFVIQGLNASSNEPGSPTQANATSSTARFENKDTKSHTIVVNIMGDGFTAPFTPPDLILLSHIGGTVFTGGTGNSLSYLSCVGPNTLAGCPGTYQSPLSTPSITAAGSFNDDEQSTISSLISTYSLNEKLTVTLSAGSAINFSASTTLSSVPEPASIVFLGTTLIGITAALRKRMAKRS